MPAIVHWNPHRRLGVSGVFWHVPLLGRVNNFGDLLGPWIAARICQTRGLGPAVSHDQRLFTVGSIINIAHIGAREGDTVWGSGIHGNFLPLQLPFPELDIRAVRGPLSAAVLRETGNTVPEVYGDPALLIPHLWSDDELGIQRHSGGTIVVPNYHDFKSAPPNAVNPRGNLVKRIRLIASAELVVASSLHAIIIAEAYGVPTILVASASERLFKYEDYYAGTGRCLPRIASDWRSVNGVGRASPLKNWDPGALLQAFPNDLWETVNR